MPIWHTSILANISINSAGKIEVGSILGHFAFCRLGFACSSLCHVSPPQADQPTFCRYYCEMRNPTTGDFGTEPQKFQF